MRAALAITTALTLAATMAVARAEDLVATRPGVMCRSAEALGRLTLPDGDSRTHAASPRPQDLRAAAEGGCVDLAPGTTVTVRQAFRNTSIVTTGAVDGTPMVVPNVDFRPADATAAATPAPASGMASGNPGPGPAPPPGYAVVQRLAVAGPGSPVLVVLEDLRLTPKLRREAWGSGPPDMQLDPHDPLSAQLVHAPFLPARLQLLSPTGQVLAETREKDYPLAMVEPAPIHGLPVPTVFYTVDMSAGMGGFSGPATVLLTPTTSGLTPVQVLPDKGGRPDTLGFMNTLHAQSAIVPARRGGPEEIEDAVCDRTTPDGRLVLYTSRFLNGQWHRAERNGGACDDVEVMPPRSAFP